MEPKSKQLTAGALLFLAGAGSVYVLNDKGSQEKVELVADVVAAPDDQVLGKGDVAASELGAKIAEAKAPDGVVVCGIGKASNRPTEVYCENGDAGFMLTPQAAADLAAKAIGWDDPSQSIAVKSDGVDVAVRPGKVAEPKE